MKQETSSVLQRQKAPPSRRRDERGVTGLETAIILIAFVVVASVFAFTVLSTGIFSSERGKETVFAGLQEARGTIEPKGSLVANGIKKDTLNLANATWTAATNVTPTLDLTDKKEGTGSADLLVLTAFTTGLVATSTVSTADLTSQTQVSLWIKSSSSTAANAIELILDESADCRTPTAQIPMPALTADTWKLVTAAITTDGSTAVTDANKDAIICIGIEVETDLSGASNQTINVDQVEAVGLVTSIVMNLTNAVEGEAVDLTAPSDSDDNGLADSDGTHVMVVTYTDKNQLVRDLYWTKKFLGDNDSDDLLETGEKAELTVILSGLAGATPLVKDLEFSIEIKPAIGAVLVLQRRTPAVIDKVMNLN